jgi:phosphatidylglycerol---prolipoprotein diacylglyceryl transferase
MRLSLLASIPSPSSGTLSIGPLELRAYGLMIALGVIVAVWMAGKRFEAKGIGTMEDMQAIALWAVPAGVIGARLYHVITDWQRFEDAPLDAFKIWEGGLGIWGGVALGVAVGVWRGHKRGIPIGPGLDSVAPAIALAQAIGRWGNWFNQELFGRPTTLPWGLEIDLPHRPAGYEQYETFHPTFLYESLWLVLIAGVLLWIDTKRPMRPGRLFVLYVALYTFGRFWIERMRIDEANTILGLRVNEWTSSIICLLAVGFLVVDWLRHRHDPPEVAAPAQTGTDEADEGDERDGEADREGETDPSSAADDAPGEPERAAGAPEEAPASEETGAPGVDHT